MSRDTVKRYRDVTKRYSEHRKLVDFHVAPRLSTRVDTGYLKN